MADFDLTSLTTDNPDINTYTSVADVMKKNYNNLITVEKAKNSSTTINKYSATFNENKYSATFNEPFIPKSGDNYTKPDKLDGTGYSWSTEQQKEVNESEKNFQTQHIGADKYKADKAAEVAKRTSDQGNSTYLDNNKTTRDAFGREVETGSGYDLHSGITPEDKSINSVASDPTLNNNAQRAIIADEKLKSDVKDAAKAEFAAKNLKLKNEILASQKVEEGLKQQALHDKLQNDRIDTIANLSDSAAAKKQKAEERAATEAAELAAKQLAVAKREALVKELKVEDEIADFEAQLAKDLKADEKAREIEAYDAEQAAQLARTLRDSKINLSQDQRNADIKARVLKLEKEKELAAKIVERDKKWAEINENNDKLLAQQEFMDNLPGKEDIVTPSYQPGVGSNQSQYEIANQRVVEVTKQAEQDAINNTTIKDMTTTVREIEAERAKKDADRRIQQAIDDEQSTNAKKIEEQRIDEAKQVQGSLDDEQLTNAKNKEAADTQRSLDDEQNFNQKGQNERRLADIKSQENLKTNAKTTPLGQSVQVRENQKKASLAKQLREKEIETYQNQLLKDQNQEAADTIGSKMNRDAYFIAQSKDPFAFSTLAYPRNLTNSPQIGHYLLFYVNVQNKTGYEYEGVTPTDGDYSVGDIVERAQKTFSSKKLADEAAAGDDNIAYRTSYYYDKGADKGDINYQKRQVQRGGTGNTLRWNQKVLSKGRKVLTGMKSVHKTTTRITDSVALYMPSASNNTSVQYQDFETGMAGFLALGGKGVLDKILNNDYEGAASKFMGMGGTMLVEMLKKVGVEAVSAFTGANGVQQAFDKAFGQTLNPYLEVAFQSMGVRSFSYTFNFTPKNEEESKDVKAIIELFRFHMLPELKGAQHRYLTLPSTFDIHYMYQANPAVAKENDFMSKIATCVLTKCDVDYTPDGVRSFDSGAPAAQTMTLEFMETEMLTKEKVQQGF